MGKKQKTKGRNKRRKGITSKGAQDAFLELMGGQTRPQGPVKRTPEQIRRRLVRDQRKREASVRSRAIRQGQREAEQAWTQLHTSKGRKSTKGMSASRSAARKEREAAIAEGNAQAFAAWEAEYGNS